MDEGMVEKVKQAVAAHHVLVSDGHYDAFARIIIPIVLEAANPKEVRFVLNAPLVVDITPMCAATGAGE